MILSNLKFFSIIHQLLEFSFIYSYKVSEELYRDEEYICIRDKVFLGEFL